MHRVEAACLVAGLRKAHSELVAHQLTALEAGALALAARVAVAVEAVALAIKDTGEPSPGPALLPRCDCTCAQCDTGAHCQGERCHVKR